MALESRTGATILGIERGKEVVSTVPDAFVLESEWRLIVVGTQEAHDAVTALVDAVP